MIDKSNVNKDRVRLLVDALRSGRFVQGHNKLKQISASGRELHCCLGVACVIAMRNGLDISEWPRDERESDGSLAIYFGDPGGDYSGSTLPHDVIKWYGFDVSAPNLETSDPEVQSGVVSSIWANDVGKWSFSKIADAFERTYLGEVS